MNPRLRHGIGLLRAGLPLLPMALIAMLLFLWACHPAMPYAPALGAAADLLPSMFNRYVHVNLMAHWLILWALWLFVDARRAGWGAVMIVAVPKQAPNPSAPFDYDPLFDYILIELITGD